MNDAFAVDPDVLVARAGQLDDLVGRVDAIHRVLAESLAVTGRCWGDDAVGQSFGAAHEGPAEAALAQLASLTERLGEVGTRITDTATSYTGTDLGAADRLLATDPDR